MTKPVPYPKAPRLRLLGLCEVVEDAATALRSFLGGLGRSGLPDSTRMRWARIATRAYSRHKYVAQSIRERIGNIPFQQLVLDEPPFDQYAWLEWASETVACAAGAMVAAVPMEGDYPDDGAHKRAFFTHLRMLASVSGIHDELAIILLALKPGSGPVN